LDLVTSGIPKVNEDGTPVDEPYIRQSLLGYDHMCALGTQMNIYYERHLLPDSPSGTSASAALSDAPDAADGGNGATSAPHEPLSYLAKCRKNIASYWPPRGFVI
jgi:hypothetical protein